MYSMSRYLAVQKSETSRYIINIMISVIPRDLDLLVSDTCYYVFNMRMYDMSKQLNILMSLMSWYLVNIYIYICKTQIRVRPQIRVLPSNPCTIITSCSDSCPPKALSPQICVLWCHTQIYVLSKTYLLRYVFSDVIIRSMSSKIYVPSDLCTRPRIDLWIYFILIALILIL